MGGRLWQPQLTAKSGTNGPVFPIDLPGRRAFSIHTRTSPSDRMSLNSGRTAQYKQNEQFLRHFGLHGDVIALVRIVSKKI